MAASRMAHGHCHKHYLSWSISIAAGDDTDRSPGRLDDLSMQRFNSIFATFFFFFFLLKNDKKMKKKKST